MPTPIETNTATMQALLEKLAGKAAGGGGANFTTRAVDISADYSIISVIASVVIDGNISVVEYHPDVFFTTIANVLAGSILIISIDADATDKELNTYGAEHLWDSGTMFAYNILSTEGGFCTIKIYDKESDDGIGGSTT